MLVRYNKKYHGSLLVIVHISHPETESFYFGALTFNSLPIDLTVSACTTLETQFTVLNGYVGGTVYIEGTTQNFDSCHHTLAGSTADVFQLTFETCGVTYGFLASSV
jgi:hypothetical protein